MIRVNYAPALPGAQPQAAHGPGDGTGAAKSHDMPQGFTCSKDGQGPCMPPRESQQRRAGSTPSPGARALTCPCPPTGSGRSLAASPKPERCPTTCQAALVLNKSWSSEKPYCVHTINKAHAASLMSSKCCASFRAIPPARATNNHAHQPAGRLQNANSQ